jgi:RNase P/RNase MRP subunit p29
MHAYNNKNIVLHELVGLEATVLDSKDHDQIGISGRVVMETKNLLYIKSGKSIKLIPKLPTVFAFSDGVGTYRVEGSEICFGSAERTAKALRFYSKRNV